MIPPLLALFSYPLVVLLLFLKLPLRSALIWTTLIGYLFLPPGIIYNLPVLPALDKATVPALSGLICLLVLSRSAVSRGEALPGWIPGSKTVSGLIVLLLVGGFLTIATNPDQRIIGATTLPGLRIYDGFSSALSTLMIVLPLLLARKFLASEESHRMLLQALAFAGAIYSLPIIFELVMSPQLNRIVYGYFPHDWRQHVRGDGYRPVVFLKHGLWLGIFMACAVLATFAYARVVRAERKVFYLLLGTWLFVMLLLSKTLGAFSITLALLPVVMLFRPRVQFLCAAVIAGSVLFYPSLRAAGLIPTQQITQFFEQIDPNRASSLRHRLNNEDRLLAHANERPLFGWGGWNRARVYDEGGRDISTTDGYWVIRIGEKGWAGYIGQFGLLCLPIIFMALRPRKYDVSIATSGLALVLAANLVDLIPNAGLTPVTWMIAGALVGRLERHPAQDDPAPAAAADAPLTPSRYSRFPGPGARAPGSSGTKTAGQTRFAPSNPARSVTNAS